MIRRELRRLGVPLTVAGAGARPRLGSRRAAGLLPGLGPTRRRPARAPPGGERRGRRRAARRPRGGGHRPDAGRARRRGYATARWPGRLELVDVARRRPREVLLDGAHNPDGAAALAQALEDLRPYLAGGRADPPPARARLGVDGRQGRRRDPGRDRGRPAVAGATVVCTALDVPRAMPAARAGRRVAGAPCRRDRRARSPTPTVPSTSRWRPATARWSWPGRCTSSARRARGWSTTRCSRPGGGVTRRAAGGAERGPGRPEAGGAVHPFRLPAARPRVPEPADRIGPRRSHGASGRT